MALLPEVATADQLAARFGVPVRTLKEFAREIGACRILGNSMWFTEDDVNAIMEAARPCPSKSTSAVRSGTIEAPLMGDDYAALQKRLTAKQQKGSKRKSSNERGNVISMGRRPA